MKEKREIQSCKKNIIYLWVCVRKKYIIDGIRDQWIITRKKYIIKSIKILILI